MSASQHQKGRCRWPVAAEKSKRNSRDLISATQNFIPTRGSLRHCLRAPASRARLLKQCQSSQFLINSRTQQESRAVAEKPRVAAVNFDTHWNLQRHRAVLHAIARLLLETRIIGLHFAANGIDLSSFIFFWLAAKNYFHFCKSDVSAFQGHSSYAKLYTNISKKNICGMVLSTNIFFEYS